MKYEKKIVKNYTDANRLISLGFRCLGINIDKKDKSKFIFWFENSEEVNNVLKDISEKIKEENSERL